MWSQLLKTVTNKLKYQYKILQYTTKYYKIALIIQRALIYKYLNILHKIGSWNSDAPLIIPTLLLVWMLIKHSQYCYPIIYCHFLQFPMENSEETRGVRQKHGKQQRSWAGIEMGALTVMQLSARKQSQISPKCQTSGKPGLVYAVPKYQHRQQKARTYSKTIIIGNTL